MLQRLRLLLLLMFAAWAAAGSAPARAQSYSPQVQRVVTRAFAATGGSGWYLLRGWHETGRIGDSPYERWIDPVRYGMRIETRDAGGLHIHGFNGQATWQVEPNGAMTAVNDHPSLAEARTAAFFGANLFLFPGRFGAHGDYLGVRAYRGRRYEVIRVLPFNGRPRELWFDAATHLLGRIVDRGSGLAIAVSDYRKVGPVRVAFRYAPENGAPVRQIQTLAFAPADRGLFSLDQADALARVQRAARPAP
jgi:hypothetical protein